MGRTEIMKLNVAITFTVIFGMIGTSAAVDVCATHDKVGICAPSKTSCPDNFSQVQAVRTIHSFQCPTNTWCCVPN
ncbi:hypothetical protein NP233_g8746 [Leucocoprinus birnbaumii]|uniref:Uncharacterized protein n=1 Tax=Leucocoprinus birnbaumii TaxID=56174 RepID=A0AAD5VLU7_9AGAR|nr:hypothetical protein NP233_g8746 [Leucocoprinus birnbaumii]